MHPRSTQRNFKHYIFRSAGSIRQVLLSKVYILYLYILYIRCLWSKTLGSKVVVLGSLDCFVVFSKTAWKRTWCRIVWWQQEKAFEPWLLRGVSVSRRNKVDRVNWKGKNYPDIAWSGCLPNRNPATKCIPLEDPKYALITLLRHADFRVCGVLPWYLPLPHAEVGG